ncbi:MAG TPA: polyprenyl synthetase family protein [Bacillota bacterium]|nr:polyprenyl synthetase family protein [Fastidiosipila sp.]HPX92951.1 polyprenyl synthetase family protein [Bacillota bacterium]HQB80765.1 polyprenyl synthetase family protein [Bacillota bacterium]
MKDLEGEAGWLIRLERLLEKELTPRATGSGPVWEAARYSLLGGGKRIRPRLLLAAASLPGSLPPQVLPFAGALEMVHTYSLIHDDLPSMDNDDYRRGRPACHKVYGEARAILAGDLLLNRAFELMIRVCREKPDAGALRAMEILGRAAGGEGMILGQDLDLALENKPADSIDISEVLQVSELKTSRLIRAALLMGGALAGVADSVMEELAIAGTAGGIAFQIKDDILDSVSNRDTLGKTPGKDQLAGKKTWVTMAGLEGAYLLLGQRAGEVAGALDRLRAMGFEIAPLENLMRSLIERKQ